MSPTARQRRYQALQSLGCLACLKFGHVQPSDMHHLLSGTHRRGDAATIPLCHYHHRGVWQDRFPSLRHAQTLLGPSLVLEPIRFRVVFGSDEYLLAEAERLIAKIPRPIGAPQ